ncbi:histone-lysine N-methyltransferase, H3 lysine-9 specific SUVH6 [Medicago truncatula]|uniref:histone-lysine N-methyltransferase, H3 lysine-9 specific SUVH6 n=1 Tax=Medicago truncatula TaxID=3880 RepID=UPI000D2F2F52|nr:histone-lysine N-methyltransferase, H3 lysine-9 specific SUVH6 [Medicago truncatula]XP_024637367.1 histone-lysine N-methyltransferase, H3 lysine-9 specific SUVH6 [Medicago truncatula]
MNSVKLERCSKVSAGRIVVRGLASMSEWKEMKRKGKKGVLNHSGRIEMKNGDSTIVDRPKFKRWKISADGTSVGDKSGKDSGEAYSPNEEKYPQDFGLNDLLVTNTVEQTSDCTLKEDPMVLSDIVDGDNLANDEPAKVELVGIESMDTEFATEDCTLNKEDRVVPSQQLDLPILETFDVEFATESCSLMNENDVPILETFDVEFATEDCSLKNKNAVISSHQMDESNLAKDEPAKLELAGMETLDTEFATEGSVKQDLSYISKASYPVGEAAMSDDSKSSLSNINIGGSGPCMKEALTIRYATRKRVAEFRGFPSLCGGNAPRLSQDECLKELSSLKEVADTDVKEAENNKRKFDNIVQADSAGNPKLPEKHNHHHHQVNINSKAVVKVENMNTVKLKSNSKVSSGRIVVRGLASMSEWKEIKRKGKKVDFNAQLDRSKPATKSRGVLNHSGNQPLKKKRENSSSAATGQLVTLEKNSLDSNENNKHFKSVTKSPGSSVNVFPLGRSNLSGHENDSVARNKVRKALRLFQAFYRKILQEAKAKPKSNEKEIKRFDLQAAKKLKEEGNYVNEGENILGSVPGVEVGDEFQYRVELNIIGLHREIQGGIDYVKQKDKILATSIVDSGGYADDLNNSDVLIYTGQRGNVTSSDKEPEDQKLERGNLALKNSSVVKNSVRVIRGSESMDGKSKKYVYDGLYVVESCWQDIGPHGKLIYKFCLRRIPGQPELSFKEVKKSKKFKTREGLCVEDISYGKEKIPICAVNTIDNEKPPTFKYVTEMIYPECCNLIPPKGCNCTNGCSDHKKCSCVVKNGGEIPFNHNGDIVKVKPLVYECGPKCKCPSTCHNRVSQLGINIQLEIFKTNSMGWGVRSLNSIPSGSFICEYIGEVLEEKEAEQRTSNDEYLFDIGNNKNNNNLWDGLSNLFPNSHSSSSDVVKDFDFTIDGAQFGNVGRFVNHSCSPNLYAQNVLYDHQDTRVPHIMLFAAENIPPLQELTYDYNYTIDTVLDSDGNMKKKYCFCGSVECTGRLY